MDYRGRRKGFEENPLLGCDISIPVHLGIRVNVCVLWPEVNGGFHLFWNFIEVFFFCFFVPVDGTAYVS